ncbi:MAG: DUF58 domain-containing protein [Halanaeroarchaeum sp.]
MTRPSPTARGWTVAVVVLGALAMGWAFGGRSLNAVIVPGVIALALTGVALSRTDRPAVERSVPEYGFQGDELTVDLHVESSPAMPARVIDHLPTALSGDASFRTITDGRTLTYDVTLERRGVHRIGGVRVETTDPLGLWRRSVEIPGRDGVTVYPSVRPLAASAPIVRAVRGPTDERDHFDSVREYTPGDPLRDVNWKTSAKRPRGLYVTEFAGTGETRTVVLGVEATTGSLDATAEAAASVAVHLLDAGAPVGVVTPDGDVDPAVGDPHRRRILGLLATFDGGTLEDAQRDRVDVSVRGDGGGEVAVVAGEDRTTFAGIADRSAEGWA